MTYEEAVSKMRKDFDLAIFVEGLVESWDDDQLRDFAYDNLFSFYQDHPETLAKDYAMFEEDEKANHVLGY